MKGCGKRIGPFACCTVVQGDCLKLMQQLPENSVDAVIVDPVWPHCPKGLLRGSENPELLFAKFCEFLPKGIRQLVVEMSNNSDPRMLSFVPKYLGFQQVGWCQYVMPGFIGRVLGGNECIYAFGKAIAVQDGRRVVPSVSPKAQPDKWRSVNGVKHPCSRALTHQLWVVNWFSDIGEVVLDSFCGAGTTLIAAKSLGRHFLGFEIEKKYCVIARERLARTEPIPQMRRGKSNSNFEYFNILEK